MKTNKSLIVALLAFALVPAIRAESLSPKLQQLRNELRTAPPAVNDPVLTRNTAPGSPKQIQFASRPVAPVTPEAVSTIPVSRQSMIVASPRLLEQRSNGQESFQIAPVK